MADYYDMKDKMRRSAQDERAARFRATTGNDPYADEIIAAESRVAAPPRAAAPSAPQATVRGVPEGMTAEYYAPPASAPAPAPAPAGLSPAETAATRLKNARAELQRLDDIKMFYRTAGTGIGTAVGAGLAGPLGAIGGAVAGLTGGDMAGQGPAGDVARGKAAPEYRPKSRYETVEAELRAAQRAIDTGLRGGAFTEEEIATSLGLKP